MGGPVMGTDSQLHCHLCKERKNPSCPTRGCAPGDGAGSGGGDGATGGRVGVLWEGEGSRERRVGIGSYREWWMGFWIYMGGPTSVGGSCVWMEGHAVGWRGPASVQGVLQWCGGVLHLYEGLRSL